MNYWYSILIGILIGGTLGTIATALVVSCRLGENLNEQEREVSLDISQRNTKGMGVQ